MTSWLNPTLSQTWANFLAAIKGRDESNATRDYSSDSDIPDNTIRFNRSTDKWEEWDSTGSAWSDLAATYGINVSQVGGRSAGTSSGNIPISTGTKNTNLNADQVDGYDVVAVATANKVLALNTESKLPAGITGNAATATKLATARTIALTGDASGSDTFDGSGNASITVTVANNSHTHTSSNISDATSANTANKIVERDATGNFSAGTITASLSGTATNCSRSVIAGTGLTGGGALTANRTLTVSYGSAAGTACQGNDSRLKTSWQRKTASFTAASNGRYKCDNGITITLPGSPSDNDQIWFAPLEDMTASNNTVSNNTKKIMGLLENMTWDANVPFSLVYDSTDGDWRFA